MPLVAPTPQLILSKDQVKAVNAILYPECQDRREAIFITGFAGSGKTVVTKCIIEGFLQRFGPEGVIVTGMTGVAATNYENGRTLHSAFGFGKGDLSVEECVSKVTSNRALLTAIRKARVLIIDEISFIDKASLAKLSRILFRLRDKRPPEEKKDDLGTGQFGGILLIMVGDWMQLVPYALEDRTKLPFYTYKCNSEIIRTQQRLTELERAAAKSGREEDKVQKEFVWDRFQVHMLKEIKRQGGALQKFMKEIRYGWMKLTPASFEMLRKLIKPKKWPAGLDPVELYCTRAEVIAVNNDKLEQLLQRNVRDGVDSQLRTYHAIDILSEDCVAASAVEHEILNLTNLPAELHCAVGQPVICLKNSFSDDLVNGSQGVVIGFVDEETSKSKQLKVFGSFLGGKQYPIVRFLARGSLPERVIVMAVTKLTLESAPGVVFFSRQQVPIMPAWALTVHKAQGLSIDYLIINLSRLFCPNQFYSAITRATEEEFTQIVGLTERQIDLLQMERRDEAIGQQDKEDLQAIKRKFMHLFDAQSAYKDHWDRSVHGKAFGLKFQSKRVAYIKKLAMKR